MSYRISEPKGTLTVASTGEGKTGFILQGANITSGLTTLTITTTRSLTTFKASDVGKAIQVVKAGASSSDLYTTIASFNSSTSVELTATAGTTVTNSSAFWYPVGQDDTTAIQNAINATTDSESTVYLPAGVFVISSTLTSAPYLKKFVGDGLNQTYVVVSSSSFTGDMLSFSYITRGIEVSDISFKHTGPTTASATATITAWSIDGSNVATLTATNSFVAGQPIVLAGFIGTGSIFNNTFATVLSSGLSGSQFEINFTHSSGSGTDTGVAHLDYNCLSLSIPPTNSIIIYANVHRVQMINAPGDGLKMASTVVSKVKECVALTNKGNGFAIYNSGNTGSTSTIFDNCYANTNRQGGYYLDTVLYSSFSSCAADGNGVSYYFHNTKSISLNGCGSEATANNNAAYPGYSYYFHGGQGNVMNGCYATSSGGAFTQVVFDNTASNSSVISCVFTGANAASAYSIASGCSDITIWEPYISGSVTAGTNSGTNSTISLDGALQDTSHTTTDFITVGTFLNLGSGTVAGSGSIRASTNTTMLASRNNANSANIRILRTNTSDSITLGDSTSGGNIFLSTPDGYSVSMLGAGGNTAIQYTLNVNGATTQQFANTVQTPTIKQGGNTTADGYALTIQAQNSTNASSTGGALVLTSGTGTSVAGNVQLQTGGTTKFTVTPTQFTLANATAQFTTGLTTPSINQADNTTNSATATSLTVQAQNATGTSATGGALILTSGTGTTAAGTVRIQTGGTNRLSISPTTAQFADTATALTITPVSAGATLITFAATATGAQLVQTATSTSNGATMQVKAQNATGDGYNGGQLVLGSGSASGAATANGGNLTIGSGAGTSANGNILFANRDSAGNFNTFLTYALTGTIGTGGSPAGTFTGTFPNTITTVAFSQSSTSANDGYSFSITAQPTSKSAATGGTLSLSAGNSTGTSTTTGGTVTISAGNATGGGTNTGGSVTITSGTGTTAGNINLQAGGTTQLTVSTGQTQSGNNTKGTETNRLPSNVQTTNATVTTIDSWTIASSTCSTVTALITAIDNTDGYGGSWQVSASFICNSGGTTSQLGSTTITAIGTPHAGWTGPSCDNSGTTIRIRVAGATSTTIQWACIVTRLDVVP